ncbi:MAG: protein kinase [Planctomycetes bacterium]|nr:protein kinase [Planctomycetota bacterium]
MNGQPQNPHDAARHKAVLAAILAVQRGHLAPDEAVRVLAELPSDTEPMQTLLQLAPANVRTGLKVEAESLAENPDLAAQTLASFGISRSDASSLLTGTNADTARTVKETLLTVAGSRPATDRVTEAISRLPKAGDSGRYTVKSEFARGGMGRVLLALDNAVGREVAMKELLPSVVGSSSLPASARDASRGELVERFLREAKVTGQLEHPNIVPVYEIGSREDGRVFYTMKLVRGKTLASRLKAIQTDETLDAHEKLVHRLKLLDAFHDVCNAIAYAHSRHVIHRDLKPANIMLGEYGETLVLDWGLARVQGQEDRIAKGKTGKLPDLSPSLLQEGSDARTLDGAVLGTPAYMPPEQARGELVNVDERSDVYALGAMLYEILAGRPPYEGPTAQTVLAKVLVLEPESLAKVVPEAPRELVALADKAMAREKNDRIGSARHLAMEIAAYRDGRALSVYQYSTGELMMRFVRRNRTAVGVALAALVALLCLGTYAVINIADERDQARSALNLATQERESRERVERQNAEERARLVSQRRREVDSLQAKVAQHAAAGPTAIAERLLQSHKEDPLRTLEPAKREESASAVKAVLALAVARESLLAALTEPVAGRSEDFASTAELAGLRKSLRDERLLATHLATANEDFALAEVILQATVLDAAERQAELSAIEEAGGALLRRNAQQIQSALGDIRQGLWRSGRPRNAPRFDDYLFKLSSFRQPQTVTLLADAMAHHREKAADTASTLIWTQVERDEVTLICRVLATLELPDLAIPPLIDFLSVVRDDRLSIECAEALCLTNHVAAYAPLVALRARVTPRSFVWSRVRTLFPRVPEPVPPMPAETSDQLLNRATLRREQNLTEPANEDIRAAYLLSPDSPAAIMAFGTTFGTRAEAKPHHDRAIALKPDFGPAWRERSMWNFRNGNMEQALSDADQAIALDPTDVTAMQWKGYYLGQARRSEEAMEITLKATEITPWNTGLWANVGAYALGCQQYERALAACSRALELDPRQQEAWINRGAAKKALGDIDGALADFTRVLEITPGYAWAHYNRAHIYLLRKDYETAIYEFTQTLSRTSAYLREAFYFRAQCHRELKDYPAALADLRSYHATISDAAKKAELETEIAEVEALIGNSD